MNNKHSQKGFTLIELLVSVSLFSLFVTIATGLFLSSIQGQRKIFTFQAVQDNSRYVLEYMAREMRMGKNFLVSGPPGGGYGDAITFTNQKGETIIYCTVSGVIKRAVNASPCSTTGSDITSSSAVIIDKLEFLLLGGDVADQKQPRITVLLKVRSAAAAAVGTSLDLQTTVSARKLES